MKFFKKFLLIFILIPCIFIFSACNTRSIVSIQEVTNGNGKEYVITYSDNTTQSLFINDGNDLKIEDLYSEATQNGYEGTILDFMREYLARDNSEVVSSKGLRSTVAIFSEFTTSSNNVFFGALKDVSIGAGAGVIYSLDKESGDAIIITNYHMLYNTATDAQNKMARRVVCFLYGSYIQGSKTENLDDRGYPIVEYSDYAIECEYIGGSLTYDIAVLKISSSDIIKSSNCCPVVFGNSENVRVGATAVAIGNPDGAGFSATRGIVSVDSEYIQVYGADGTTLLKPRVIRIDAAINGGNSGGGLFNGRGELIGIVNSKIVSERIDNIAYAIPSNVVKGVVENIIRNAQVHNGKAYKALFGLVLGARDFTVDYDTLYGAITKQEIYIKEKAEGGVCSQVSALEINDVIEKMYVNNVLALDNVTHIYQINDLTWTLNVGDIVKFKLAGKNSLVEVYMAQSAFSEVA